MNYIQSQLENSLSDRFIEIPTNEADNEFMEINLEFSLNEKFCSKIEISDKDLTFNSILTSICAAFEVISKNTSDDFYFIRPQFIFRPYPNISIIGKIKLRKKEEEDMKKQAKASKLDEKLGMKDGKESTKKQPMKARRDESKGMKKGKC